MNATLLSIRDRLDKAGVLLSGLCAVHCLLGVVLVAGLGLGGGALLNPDIHRVGLALALLIGIATIGIGAVRHGRFGPLAAGALGLTLMAFALAVGHGWAEGALTVTGVAFVAAAHIANLRQVS